MNPIDFTNERVSIVDKIFVKTNYHRSLYPNVPDDKFVVVGNGIDLDRFIPYCRACGGSVTISNMKGIKLSGCKECGGDGRIYREPYRFVYSSTPDRGLDVLLEFIWADIKKEFPKAELHLYYGWHTFEKLEKNNPERMAWMRKVKKLMEQDGVINHGRVGQQELAEDLMKTSYWLYPTNFAEIHCITACEMQAAGVIPITSGYAALAETQKVGVKLEGDIHDPLYHKRYIQEVIKTVKENDGSISKQAREEAKQFSWDLVVNAWDKELCK